MNEQIEKFNKLLYKLSANQIEFLYHLGCKLFGQAPDKSQAMD